MKILNTAVAAALLVPPTSAFLAPIGLVTHRNTSPFFAVPSESEENMGKAKEKNNGEIEVRRTLARHCNVSQESSENMFTETD